MAGALLFGAVCGFIAALLFAPISLLDQQEQIEKAQKEQKEQIEKEQKERKEQIEKEQKEKSKQSDKSSSAMASKNKNNFCIKNCPDVWQLRRE